MIKGYRAKIKTGSGIDLDLFGAFDRCFARGETGTSHSSLLVGTSIVTENILSGVKPGMDDRTHLRWTRGVSFVIGVISQLLAHFAATIYKLASSCGRSCGMGQFAPIVPGLSRGCA